MTNRYEPPRRWPRLSCLAECRIEGISRHAPARVTELSIAGGYVDTNAPFSTGDHVRFVMVLDDTEAPVTARVIYAHTGIGFGFTFELDQMDLTVHRRIAALLGRDATGQSS